MIRIVKKSIYVLLYLSKTETRKGYFRDTHMRDEFDYFTGELTELYDVKCHCNRSYAHKKKDDVGSCQVCYVVVGSSVHFAMLANDIQDKRISCYADKYHEQEYDSPCCQQDP